MRKMKRLAEYHKRALEMKYKGVSYREIAEKLNERYSKKSKRVFSEQTIKDWFKEGGTLFEDYRKYESEIDEIERENLIIIKKMGVRIREENFLTANKMLVALMGSETDSTKLGAIKELLDRVEGKPREAITIDENRTSYEQIIRELEQEEEEYKKSQENDAVGKSA